MRTFTGVLACLLLGSSMTVLAQEPAPQAAAPSATPATPASPAQDAASGDLAAPAAAPTASESATPATPEAKSAKNVPAGSVALTDEDRSFIRRGYQIEVKNGDKYYCRQQQTMGSRLNNKRVCMRSDQMEHLRENAQDATREAQKNNKYGGS